MVLGTKRSMPELSQMAKQRARGGTTKEAIRKLKRHLIRRVYNLLKRPTQTPSTLICG
jgi:hypothetical protein